MKTETVKGFNDYTGKEAEKRAVIQEVVKNIFERYGFEPAETPIVEYEEFVKGENSGDEAVSDIFRLKDKGGRKLALRYEFTFQLKRLIRNKKLPYRRFQIGPVFRDEPVSSNRFRQFTQCDADVIGATVKEEAEILAMAVETLNKLGIKPMVLINNRKLLNEILDDLKVDKNREQVLRELDKYDKLPEKEVKTNLKKFGAERLVDVLKQGEEYFSKFQSYREIISLMDYCRSFGLKITFSPTVVRGLGYYDGSVFEIKVKGMKETVVAGGSYSVGDAKATGISFGLERIAALAKIEIKLDKTLVVSLNKDREAIKLAQKLRSQGKNVVVYYGKPSKALEYANAYGIKRVIFVGERETKMKKFKVKDMKTGKEKLVVVGKL